MNMIQPRRFERVKPEPAFQARCWRCNVGMSSERHPIYADPTGTAYGAFYCEICAGQKREEGK